jgi:hypothetical protein
MYKLLLTILYVAALKPDIEVMVSSKFGYAPWVSKLNLNYKIYQPKFQLIGPGTEFESDYEKGYEFCMVLKYIIDNYDTLKTYTIFLHDHEFSWHSDKITNIIPRLNFNNLGYANLNFRHFQVHLPGGIFPRSEYDKMLQSESPPYFESYCCFQNIIHKDVIRRNHKSRYQHISDWLQNTTLPNEISSRMLEYSWAYIMGMPYDLKPYRHGLCSIIHCTKEELKNKNFNFQLRKGLWYEKY